MPFELIAFYVFAAVALSSAVAVISFKNPMHSVLSLVLTFFSTACLWLLLQAEFLGIVLVLVYIGAVMILFLFVVMMLDVHATPKREGFIKHFPVAMIVAAVILTVAIVVAVLLTLRRREGTKTQNPSQQVLVRASDRVRLIKMSAVTKPTTPESK